MLKVDIKGLNHHYFTALCILISVAVLYGTQSDITECNSR